jgi:spore maturation protein CgeB
MNKIKLLYLNLTYDYNSKDFGLGYGYYNNHLAFQYMKNLDYLHFDICDFGDLRKRKQNNQEIIRLVEREKPDILFYGDFDGLVYPETLRHIKDRTSTTTLHWFCDDQWRFDSFSKDYCWNFDYCITTDREALPKYKAIGYEKVILSQWAANQHIYKKRNMPYMHEISFVGQPHGVRRETIDQLKKENIRVAVFGNGWRTNLFKKKWNRLINKLNLGLFRLNTGMISHPKMLEVFCSSKINLNLSSNSSGLGAQMKGRHFEIPACGGFMLTDYNEEIEQYYAIGKEVECYSSFEELIDKIRFYLAHDKEREEIARAGHERTLRDHTWDKRFKEIFSAIKLKN